MSRLLVVLSGFAVLLYSCGPDKRPCSGEEPEFKVILKLTARPLPSDTVVHVTYAGSGKEEFHLSEPDARLKVTFCKPADENGAPLDASAPSANAAAGAGGASDADDASGVPAIYCELRTAGFTQLEITGTGFTTVESDLRPKANQCTVDKLIVLDDLDAGKD